MLGKKKTIGRHSVKNVIEEKQMRIKNTDSVINKEPVVGSDTISAHVTESSVNDNAGETNIVPDKMKLDSCDTNVKEPSASLGNSVLADKKNDKLEPLGYTQKNRPVEPKRSEAMHEESVKEIHPESEPYAKEKLLSTDDIEKHAKKTEKNKPENQAASYNYRPATPAVELVGASSEKTNSRIKNVKTNTVVSPKGERSKGSTPSIPAIIISALLITAILFVILMVIKVNILPMKFVLAGILILSGLAFICVALTWSMKKPVRFAVGFFLTIVMIAGLVIGSYVLKRAWDTAQKVTASSVTMAEVGVYVKADDKAASIEDLGGYTFGVLKTQDRDDANKALLGIASDLNLTIYVAEYDSVIKLISALYKDQVQAAVIETYHIEMLASMENSEYTEIAEIVRLVGQYEVESSSSDIFYEFGDIDDSPLRKEEATPVELGYEDHTIAIYVSGIDSYGAVNVKSRSDVNVLAFINDKTHQIFLVSTPRDYYVQTTVSGEQRDKLTHAGLYGPECSMGTLANLYDCDVDYYFRINFSGFMDVVDALGGIDVEIWDGYPKVHLNGEDALLVARDRHSIGGEVNRGDRHMRIISAVINQVLSTDIIYNYNDVLDAVSGSFDSSVPYDLISRMVKEQIETNPSWEIIKYTVSGYGNSDLCFSLSVYDATGGYAYVLYPNYDTVQLVHDLVRAMERNERISQPE